MSPASRRLGRRRPITRPMRAARHGRARRCRQPGRAGEAVDGAGARVGDGDGLGPVEHQHRAGLDHHAGQAGRRRLLDGARPDGRHVDAQLLARLRALGQHALRRAAGLAQGKRRHALAAWRRCPPRPRSPAPCRAPPRRPGRRRRARAHAARQSRSRRRRDPPRSERRCPWRPAAASRSGATSWTPSTSRPLPSKKRTTRVSTESSPPASRRRICGRLLKKPASGRMRRRSGRVTAPAITSCAPALVLQRRHHAADLAPVDPGVRKAGDGRRRPRPRCRRYARPARAPPRSRRSSAAAALRPPGCRCGSSPIHQFPAPRLSRESVR